MMLVGAVSEKWSWYPVPETGGKVVWAELPIPPHPLTEAGLPQRSQPGAVIDGNHDGFICDLELLRRIHRGLTNL